MLERLLINRQLGHIASYCCNTWSNGKRICLCGINIIICNRSIELSSIMCEIGTVGGRCTRNKSYEFRFFNVIRGDSNEIKILTEAENSSLSTILLLYYVVRM